MLELLQSLGLPQNLSIQGEYIDNANVLMHWLMLYLFLGWGAFFIVSLYKFRESKNKKADYYGVKSHLSSVLEGAVAIVEIIALFGFSYPIWAYRVNDVPDSRDAVNIRVIAQQFAWNFHYPGADGVFGRTDINLVDESEQNFIGIDRSDAFAKDDIILQNQMHIPVNKKIRVDLSSKDVIHNFKLPELRVSQDAIPGMTNKFLSRFAKPLLQAFDGAFQQTSSLVTVGNPVRPNIVKLEEPNVRLNGRSESLNVLVVGYKYH